MLVTPPIQTAISERPDPVHLRRLAATAGMRPMRQAAAVKVAEGITTIDEVLALTPDPRE
jgi:general secretion pathway protein E